MNLFDLALKLKGFPLNDAKEALEKIKIELNTDPNFNDSRKLNIVKFHLENNPFYKEKVKHFTKWEDLPVLTKKDLQQPLINRLSKGYKLKNVYINKTSGSSGDPFIFAKDKFSHALTWANIQSKFGQFNIDFNSSYQARFYGIPLDKFGYYKERFKDFLSNRYRFPIFDLSDHALEIVLNKFKKTNFKYINGYTSSILLFAKFLKRKGLILKEICPKLSCCVVTSEMLFESDKNLLQQQFGIPIINEYGASELDLIAFQNTQNEWLINNETLFVEILDENNQSLPNGQVGKIVITSLYNKAHPFIRYEIGDIGMIDEKSTFQKQILKQLIGRTNDIAILPSGKKSPGLTFYYITKSIIEDNGRVKEFIVKQTKLDTFDIDYVSSDPLDKNQIKNMEAAIETYLEPHLKLNFIRKEKLTRNKSGKLTQFISLLEQ